MKRRLVQEAPDLERITEVEQESSDLASNSERIVRRISNKKEALRQLNSVCTEREASDSNRIGEVEREIASLVSDYFRIAGRISDLKESLQELRLTQAHESGHAIICTELGVDAINKAFFQFEVRFSYLFEHPDTTVDDVELDIQGLRDMFHPCPVFVIEADISVDVDEKELDFDHKTHRGSATCLKTFMVYRNVPWTKAEKSQLGLTFDFDQDTSDKLI